jgi:hypothetical protein
MGNYVCACFGAQGRTEPYWKVRRSVDLHSEIADLDSITTQTYKLDSITTCKLKEVERNLESIWKGDVPKDLQTKAGTSAPNEAGTLAGEGSEEETFADTDKTLLDEHGESHAANETRVIDSEAGTLDREESLLTKEATRQKISLMQRKGKPRR